MNFSRTKEGTRTGVCALFLVVFFFTPVLSLHAFGETTGNENGGNDKLSLTIYPPIFQLRLAPGSTWKSQVAVYNGGGSPVALRAFTQNFSGNRDDGTVMFFVPKDSLSPNTHELATWITFPEGGTIIVPPGKRVMIPFTLSVPADAEPGGHYASILVGNEPGKGISGGATLNSLLSSLFFVRVIGDVEERGAIREFVASHVLSSGQSATFNLSFINTGNVHLSPEGRITIYNMFGRERGRVSIDTRETFGVVLPLTTRTFSFTWSGEQNFFDIGVYKAVAELRVGTEKPLALSEGAHFLVLPMIPFLTAISLFTFMWWFGGRVVRRYVKEAIALELAKGRHKKELTGATLMLPLREGIHDFGGIHNLTAHKGGAHHGPLTYKQFLRKYWRSLISFGIIILGLVSIGWYFYQVFEKERDYQVIRHTPGGDRPISVEK